MHSPSDKKVFVWASYRLPVTEYVNHHRIDWKKRPDKYLASVTYGTGAEIKTKAYQKALELIIAN